MAKLNCTCGRPKDDCCPFRKIVIPAVMGDDSEDSPSAPKNGAYRNALVEYEANGAMYIYASDGIFTKISMVAGDTGAASVVYVDTQDDKTLDKAKAYANAQDAATLQVAKDYADAEAENAALDAKGYADTKGAEALQDAKGYTDTKAADTLQGAKEYADAKDNTTLSSAKSYTDTEAANTLQDAKDYADGVGASTLASANAATAEAISAANVPVFTLSNVDIAEGSELAANNFYGVYE